jgi:hypothetical protein
MNTISRGNAAEAAALCAFAEAGLHVLVPFGDGLPFDLAVVMPDGETLVRVQVKSGRVRGSCVVFNACNTDHGSGRSAYTGKADVIMVHVAELRELFVVPVSDCPAYAGSLRLEEPRNNQRIGIRFAQDYSFRSWLQSGGAKATAAVKPTPSTSSRR